MVRYKDMQFIDGMHEIHFTNKMKAVVTHEKHRKEYCNDIPNIEFYSKNGDKLKPIGGMCQPFGYTEEEIDDLLIQAEASYNAT